VCWVLWFVTMLWTSLSRGLVIVCRLPDDSESDDEDAVTSSKEQSDDAEERSFAKATDAKPVAG